MAMISNRTPSYLSLDTGMLRSKAAAAKMAMCSCTLCPRRCRVDRTSGDTGFCRTAENALVAGYNAHFGEESPLVGVHGSGTIFFSHCNLRCNFCQNYDISQEGEGREVNDRQLADIMLALQHQQCHNINLVTPSHVIPQILNAVAIAAERGLRIPVVYNSSAYDEVESLRLLEGVVDIYMPDFKFRDASIAEQTCDAPDYPEVASAAIVEMHRQVGDLIIDDDGLTRRGLLVRHLVLPDGLAGTREVMRFIAGRISRDTYVNIMPQYRPCGRAAEVPAMGRAISVREYEQALDDARNEGITRMDPPRRVFLFK